MDLNDCNNPDADSTTEASPSAGELDFPDGDLQWTTVDPSSLIWEAEEGIAAELQYLVPGVGERDAWGVLITVNEEQSYADVDLNIPAAAPAHALPWLQALRRQRINFTAEDREHQEFEGCPYKWSRASEFAVRVAGARAEARGAVIEVAFDTLLQLAAHSSAGAKALDILRMSLYAD